MVYLQYVYSRSGLPQPQTVALFVEGSEWVKTEVRAEFAALFPASALTLHPPEDGTTAGVLILVYHRDERGREEILRWGERNRARAALAVGFYEISRRRFE